MHLFLKKICVVLSLLMLFSPTLLTACSENVGSESDTSPSQTTQIPTDESTEGTEESTSESTVTDTVKETYANTNLEGFAYKVFAPANGVDIYSAVGSVNEVYADEINGEPLNDALWQRNSATQELLNITITPVWGNSTDGIRTQLGQEVTAGAVEYSTVLNRMDYMGSSMANGHLLNLNNISTMDSSNAWWDSNVVNNFTLFDDRLYFISGDINFFDDYACEVLYFNKSLADQYSLTYPYADVIDGTWTIEKFYTMSKAVENDLNGDGAIDPSVDIVGHCEVNDHIKHWLYAMGEKCLVVNDEGDLTPTISGERHINVIDTLFDYMVNKSMSYTASADMFTNGRILFLGEMLGAIGTYREMEHEFGVLPMPKLNEKQQHYGEYVSNGWTTAYGVPMLNTQDADKIGTVLEVLCGLSTDTVRSALYDVLFAAKFVRDTESVQMLDIIFDSKSYDWATDFSWGASFANLYNGIYSSGTNTFSSNLRSSTKVINKTLENTFQKIKDLAY